MQLSILNKVALSLLLANMLFITDLEFSGYAVRYLRQNVTQAWKVIIIIRLLPRERTCSHWWRKFFYCVTCIDSDIWVLVRGAIKKFSTASPSSVQKKIKVVFASYSGKAQNMSCTIRLFRYKYFVHFCGRRLFAYDMEKSELRSVTKWQFWLLTDSFVPLHTLLFWLRIDVSSWITSCEINFCWVMSVSFEKFFRILCAVLVLAFSTPLTDTLIVHTLKCTKYLYR